MTGTILSLCEIVRAKMVTATTVVVMFRMSTLDVKVARQPRENMHTQHRSALRTMATIVTEIQNAVTR